jgi:hypothetical protein
MLLQIPRARNLEEHFLSFDYLLQIMLDFTGGHIIDTGCFMAG